MDEKVKFSRPVPPFVRYCAATIPTVFDDSLSYYECLCALWKWLQDNVIETINNNAAITEELQAKVKELKEYVENYFDNLDVQEEINNKLDEMAESGELSELLAYNNIRFYFPKSLGNIYSGDCSLIKAYGKNILIDTHRTEAKENIEAFLNRNDAAHIDYLIITHFHDDHVGNVVDLINDGFIDSETVVYLPKFVAIMEDSETVMALYNAVMAALTNNNIEYSEPDDGDNFVINDATFTFYNCSQNIVNTYDNLNNCSMLLYLDYKNNRALFTGDAENAVFAYLNEQNLINTKLTFFKVSHHGINYNQPQTMAFLRRTNPDYAVQLAEMYDYSTGKLSQGDQVNFLTNSGCKVFSTYANKENDIILDLSLNNISVKSGVENISLSNRLCHVHLYVDSSTTNAIQDGTYEHPCKDLAVAVGKIPNNNTGCDYVIHLADGEYGNDVYNAHITSSNIITIDGNENDNTAVVIKRSIVIHNGANVVINNCSFSGNGQISIEDSAIRLVNCVFDGDASPYIWSARSRINLEGTTFSNGVLGVSCHSDFLNINTTTFDTFSNAGIQLSNCSTAQISGTFTDCAENVRKYDNSIVNGDMITTDSLYSGDASSGDTITLTKDIRKYNTLILSFGYVGSGNFYSIIMNGYNGQAFGKNTTYNAGSVYWDGTNEVPQSIKFAVNADGTQLTINHTTRQLRTIRGTNLPNSAF